jgi:basic membrane protein A
VKRILRAAAVVTAAGLALSACGTKSEDSGSGSQEPAFKACMVLDVGGVDDRSFNQSSWQGMKEAESAGDGSVEVSFLPSADQNAYVPNLNAQVDADCDTTIAVGGLMTDAVASVAEANPTKHFAQVDAAPSGENVYGMQFNTAQGAFLGGYLAAAMTETGTVATYGGLNIPPVTIFMDGFWEGVQHYNSVKSEDVKVLGWDEQNQDGGTFANSFTDQNKGRSITEAFIQQGADIVFPVAGATGLGSGAAAQASNGKATVIWVDTDGCESAEQYCDVFLTSVTKNLSKAVSTYVTEAAGGTFPTGSYIGTLENDGTGLAPFHEFDDTVPEETKAELEAIEADIISGKITLTSPSMPS